MNIKFEFKKEKIKILVMAILLAGACFLTYYFHAVVRKGTVFTHLFYIPIILSSLWWKRKGIAVAIFLAALLIFSHFLLRTGIETINDLLRAFMFILISVATIFSTEKITKVRDMLWEKNDYLEKLINHANAPIIVWDKQGNITRFNTTFEDLTKYRSSELIGKHFTTIFNGRTEKEVLLKIEQTLKGEYLKSVEITVLDKPGNELILLWNSANVYSSDGENLIATIVQGTDITERKRAEEKLKERTEELEEAQKQLIQKERLAVLGQLSGSVAHELRNPLGVISNSIYYLNMKLKDKDEKVKKHLGLIKREIERSDNMIIELLDFSKVKLLYITETNVNTLIKETIEETKIPEYIDLEMDLDEKIPQLQLDPDKMQKVFQNMISNAIQAMSEKGKLHIKTSSNDDFTEISFSDNGSGITEENLKKIFEPLVTTKSTGIGLGLAIVKNIIDYHKGKIDVKSEVGKGTTFTIKLRNCEVEKLRN